MVNGQKVQTLQLDAAPFDIKDFPVVNGSNQVELIITDATGQVEVRKLDIISSADLLAAGIHEYTYNVGVVSQNIDRRIEYESDDPAFSAFHRYGVTDALTLGVNAQGDNDQQMAGIDTAVGTDWGIVGVDVAASRIKNGVDGLAGGGRYSFIHHGKTHADGTYDGSKTLMGQVQFLGTGFAPLGDLTPDNRYSSDVSLRYSQAWSPTLDLGIGGQYQFGRDAEPDDWTVSITASKLLPRNLRLGLVVEQEQEDGTGAFISLTWVPPLSRHSVSSSYDSYTRTKRLDWNYAEEGRADSFSAAAGVAQSEDDEDMTGQVTYHNARGEITAWQDVIKSFDRDGDSGETDASRGIYFGTAVAYGGGHVALSRPIGNSFAMVTKHPVLKDYTIGVNEQGDKEGVPYYEAAADRFGPAVLPDVTPYLYRNIRVHADDLPPGFDLGSDNYTLHPTYRSGTVITLGGEANVVLDGIVQYADGQPVVLEAGNLVAAGEKADDAPPFFTNRTGRFFIEKLKPGTYEMEFFRYPGVKLPVTIAPDAAGQVQAGTLTLPVTPQEDE